MNREELKKLLDTLKILPKEYSLYNVLDSDRMILYNFYEKWIVFYLNGSGARINEKTFYSEDEACRYLHHQFVDFILYREKHRPK
ncbi:MAG TPA: hypothetical protein VNY36_06480 [Bacteroidia bacterium]|nr:hypothetical protein [Bacteroidia bacterium]